MKKKVPQSAAISTPLVLAVTALVVAVVLGGAALAVTLTSSSSSNGVANYSSLSTEYSSLSSEISSIGSKLAAVNATPAVDAIKMQWCTQSVLQDRFCPGNIIVNQGDIVQVFFLQNDTASHTFTLDTPPYNFQINASGSGELDFLHNYSPIAGNCSNTGTFNQISAGISGSFCVSGTSLLPASTLQSHAANNFYVAQNPNPGLPFTNNGQNVAGEPNGTTLTNPGPIIYPVNDQVEMISMNVTGLGVAAGCGGVCETQGIGAFQATTPGIYEFFCHYHVSNGMYGFLVVLPNAYCDSNRTACGLS